MSVLHVRPYAFLPLRPYIILYKLDLMSYKLDLMPFFTNLTWLPIFQVRPYAFILQVQPVVIFTKELRSFLYIWPFVFFANSTACLFNKFDLMSWSYDFFQVRPNAFLQVRLDYAFLYMFDLMLLFYKFNLMSILHIRPDGWFTNSTWRLFLQIRLDGFSYDALLLVRLMSFLLVRP